MVSSDKLGVLRHADGRAERRVGVYEEKRGVVGEGFVRWSGSTSGLEPIGVDFLVGRLLYCVLHIAIKRIKIKVVSNQN